MTFHPERYIGFGFLLLLFSVVAPPAPDWWRGRHPHTVVEDGASVYELHVFGRGPWSVIRITSNGNAIPPDTRVSVRAPR